MVTKPVIFVSYCQRYSELKDFFVQVVEDMGFQPEIFDTGSAMSVPETERVLINKCDGFIGILTPDEQTARGYLCSQSVTAEIAMAFAANKPIQLFAINEVNFSTIQFAQVNTVAKLNTCDPSSASQSPLAFDTENIRQIFRTLLDFKKHIDEVYRLKWPSLDPVFLYKLFEIKQEIISSNELQLRNSIEAIAQRDVDTHTHAARLLCNRDTGGGITLRKEDLKLKLFKPAGYQANVDFIVNDYSSFRFSINFQQPIPKGTEVKYAYERKHSNYFPYTYEELEELLKHGMLKSRVMKESRMVGQDFYVTQPTEKIIFELNFPKKYPIKKYSAFACYGKGELVQDVETNRIRPMIQLNYNEFDEIYTLRLEITNPQLLLTYFLLYEPPKSGALDEG